MKFNAFKTGIIQNVPWHINLPVMKFALISIISLLFQAVPSFAQRLTFNQSNVTLKTLFKEITKQTGYEVFYPDKTLDSHRKVLAEFKNAPIDQVLSEVLKGMNLSYTINDKGIVISKKILQANDATVNKPNLIDVHGRIINETGAPLLGATIVVNNTPVASRIVTISGQDGAFLLRNVDPKAEISISYIGHNTVTKLVAINLGDIVMKARSNDLDQVQVIAYGTTTKRLSTGNITTITSKEIEKNPVPNVLQAIEGRVVGLNITQNTGLPGGSFSVNIRGKTTFSSSQAPPLIVVDGIIYPNQMPPGITDLGFSGQTATANATQGGNPLNFLDPSIIESVNVLKDADATAIYGSRGAYGVIIITTKKGKPGRPTLTVNTYTGVQANGKVLKRMNTSQYLTMRREAFKNDNIVPTIANAPDLLSYDTTKYTNWQKELSGKYGWNQRANISYGGGNEISSFLLGGVFSDMHSIQLGKGKDMSGTINLAVNTSSLNKKFSLGMRASYHADHNDMVAYDFSSGSGVLFAPDAPSTYNADGSLNWSTGSNPAASVNKIYFNNTKQLISSLNLSYRPFKDFSINVTIGYTSMDQKILSANPTTVYNPVLVLAGSVTNNSRINITNNITYTVDPNLSYTHKVAKKGTLQITAGGTFLSQKAANQTITGANFISDALLVNPSFAPQANVSTTYADNPDKSLGIFSTINFNWDNKYIVNINGRDEGSTKFGVSHRFGQFGSIGAAWLFTEESWFQDHLNVLSFGKIRASYGLTGGDAISPYQYLNTYTLLQNGYLGQPQLIANSLPANPNLHWETNKKSEIGFELGFVKDRIVFEPTFYRSMASDQLLTALIPSISGYQGIIANYPSVVRSSGIELNLTTQNIATKNFKWITKFNISFDRTKLLSFPGGQAALAPLLPGYIIGQTTNFVTVYNYAGIDPNTGRYLFTDKNGVTSTHNPNYGDKVLTSGFSNDQYLTIDLSPKYYGGLENSFTYKKFNVDAFISFKNQKAKNWQSQAGLPGVMNNNPLVDYTGRWQHPGDVTTLPMYTQSIKNQVSFNYYAASNGAYVNGTYARLANLHIAYDLSNVIFKKTSFNNFKIYMEGQNLLTITKYRNLDPETQSAVTAPLRVFVFGISTNI
ncbi:TonB-linked outer membrane protein, SusC/RagA family [Chitinophaga costaii]|uniref:TonB-linked outer membrane protein, SusC/RagA family n=1 Tax=Chitinophaga costaii TaxID=1335309 RepID=A0A1C4EGT0_9BACT|nr:SusC/RagA family TonB-linked outer membrane protein [Chitinophaga costaii]PUZ23836.1 SusC/RagA family TonB-linked outer membrane protein [Chitinophaga costaii]SCC42760.1 TonB-linked outer membrane protein, SusC/RagA family [Chitinophaga costaii]